MTYSTRTLALDFLFTMAHKKTQKRKRSAAQPTSQEAQQPPAPPPPEPDPEQREDNNDQPNDNPNDPNDSGSETESAGSTTDEVINSAVKDHNKTHPPMQVRQTPASQQCDPKTPLSSGERPPKPRKLKMDEFAQTTINTKSTTPHHNPQAAWPIRVSLR